MAKQKENSKPNKVEEPSVSYTLSNAKNKKASETDFDKEFENGYTSEQFKEEMYKRINAYPWKK